MGEQLPPYRINGFPTRAIRCGRASMSLFFSSGCIIRSAFVRAASIFFLPV